MSDPLGPLLALTDQEFVAVMHDRRRGFEDASSRVSASFSEPITIIETAELIGALNASQGRLDEVLLAAELRVAVTSGEIAILEDDQ